MKGLTSLLKICSLIIIICLSAAKGWSQVHADSTPVCGTILRYSLDDDRVYLDYYKFNTLITLTDELCIGRKFYKKQFNHYKSLVLECDSLVIKLTNGLQEYESDIEQLSFTIEDNNKIYNDLRLELEYLLKDSKKARRRSFWKGVYVGGGVVIVGSTAALLMVILN